MSCPSGEWAEWEEGERLELPVHHVRVSRGEERFEIFLNEREGGDWVFRRDGRIRRAVSDVVMSCAAGVPILTPEVQLLFKAKDTRGKDEADFLRVVGRMGAERVSWLVEALERCYPGHEWVRGLAGVASI